MAAEKKEKPAELETRPPRDEAELVAGPVKVEAGKRPPRDDAELAALLKK